MRVPMKDEEVTLEIKYHVIKAKDGKLKRARLEWQASGLKIYVLGPLSGHLYEQAANLAMHLCDARNIPPGSLRGVKREDAELLGNVTKALDALDDIFAQRDARPPIERKIRRWEK